MALDDRTLQLLRRTALGAAALAAAGATVVTAAAPTTAGSPSPAPEPTATQPAAPPESYGPGALDGDDCPACGLG